MTDLGSYCVCQLCGSALQTTGSQITVRERHEALLEYIRKRDEALKICKEALQVFADSTENVKEWCSFGGGVSTKWFHGVASGEVAAEALDACEKILGEKE